ncbi:MAG: redox-sensing transcriptional repressor Rex [Clostridia bacterium]|nr:redox-sensing transcriptional repressor Rex [Clostridia bacterium]
MDKQISDRVVERLPKYYRYLQELSKNQIQRVSSKTISKALNITASQVRQDLSQFGGFGQTGVGYNVEYLRDIMKEILGINNVHTAIVIGGGRIGQALISYQGFRGENVYIKAVFDVYTEHLKSVKGVEVYNVSELENYLKNNPTDIAIISVQKENAEKMAKRVVDLGVKAIWNFAPIDLYFDGAVCENINMSESLMRLIYKSKV